MNDQITILFVEDDKDLRETAQEFLVSEGYSVVVASNGAMGVQKAIASPPDVIVCDINMPDMNGYEVFSTLNQIAATAIIPFIFLSAKSTREEILLGLHLGADDYITKPFEMTQLVEIVNRRVKSYRMILAQSEEKFNTLIDSTITSACVLNETSIEYANSVMEEMLGYSCQELAGVPFTRIIHPNCIGDFKRAVAQCINQVKKSFSVSIIALPKASQPVKIDAKGSLIFNKNRPCVICTMALDDAGKKSVPAKEVSLIKLSKREQQVLDFVCKGYSNGEIAHELFVSERTVEGHRARLFSKTKTKNAVSLAMWAVKQGFVDF